MSSHNDPDGSIRPMNDASRHLLKFGFLLFACPLFLAAIGCGDSGPQLHKVTGKVTVDGEPGTSAMVVFTATDGTNTAAADLNNAGEFEMMTGGADAGLLPGNYYVQIIRVDGGSIEEGEQESVPSNIPAKYGDAETSDLTATVEAKDNVINFPLELE